MLSGILNSDIATNANIAIMRTFVLICKKTVPKERKTIGYKND